MNRETDKAVRWRPGIVAAVAVLLLALYPQLAFQLTRGREWNGTNAHAHGDEVVYNAYVNALIEGRPRRNDPYTALDERAGDLLPESYFSIQFLPAYAVALPAQLLGATTAQAFIALKCFAALASALALFWLLSLLTGDARVAACGVLCVLCFGSTQLLVDYLLGRGSSNNHLPFLRLYLPSAPFPLLFVFFALVWRMLARRDERRAALVWAALAGLVLALLVFSYFYLWTTAAAWLFCLTLLWLVVRRDARRRSVLPFAVVSALALFALVPYFLLLARRVATTDEALLLTTTHAPDVLRLPELLGLASLAGLLWGMRRGLFEGRERVVIFDAALALTPFVVFNQQVFTGRSLQPFHYGMFSANYVAVLALFLCAVLLWRGAARGAGAARRIPTRALVAVALAAFCSGACETLLGSRKFMAANIFRDEARPASLRLASLARAGSMTGEAGAVVFATHLTIADALPGVAPQPLLWAPHMFNFPGVTLEEDRERLLQYLYYTGVKFDDVDPQRFDALDNRRKWYLTSIIKRGRHNPNLTVDWTPVTPDEVRRALEIQSSYAAAFDRARAARPTLSYVLTSNAEGIDFTNLDRWYERDAGEQFGQFVLYRVKLRP